MINDKFQSNKIIIQRYKLFIFKKICALAISFCIPIGVFLGTKNLFKVNTYKVNEKTYNSYTDDVSEVTYYSNAFCKDDYVLKYELIPNSKNMYNVYRYFLSILSYSSIDEYVKYYKEN